MSRGCTGQGDGAESGLNENKSKKGLSRREVLKGATGVAVAGAVAAATGTAEAQYTGLTPDGGTVPFRLPMGAMNYLDRNQYISNMEILSHTPEVRTAGGEPLMAMWARGAQRLLPASGGWLDVSNPRRPEIVESSDRIQGCIAYNTEIKKWLMVRSAGQPLSSATPEFPHGRYHDELYRRATSYSGLRGISTWDITNPDSPVLLNEFSTGETGSGTHMNFYDGGRYAYLDAGWSDQFRMENAQRPHGNAFMVVDMSDPSNVREVSRWHVPGQLFGEEEEYKKYWFAGDQSSWTSSHGGPVVPQRVEDGGTIGYASFGHFGFYVMDFSDIRNPKPLGKTLWDFETMGGIPYHTIYPVGPFVSGNDKRQLRNIVVATPEPIQPDCREPYKPGQLLDVSDPRDPRIVGLFPRPVPPEDAPYADFCLSRGRFGVHNTQCWVAPGNARPEIMVMAMFNAGVRVYDISDPTAPRELAWFIPPRTGEIEEYNSWRRAEAETVFIEWDRNLIWFAGPAGTYCLSTPALGRPVLQARRIENWTVPHANRGWDG